MHKKPLVEKEKWIEYKIGKNISLKNEIIEEYMSLAEEIAYSMYVHLNQNVSIEEIISDSYIGLIDAVEKYDPSTGASFETYAYPRIKGAIIDCVRQRDWATRKRRDCNKKYTETISNLEQELLRSPSRKEIAEALDLDEKELRALERAGIIYKFTNIKSNEFEGEGVCEEELRARELTPEEVYERKEFIVYLFKVMEKLKREDSFILRKYYFEDFSFTEIADKLGLTSARVSQRHKKALVSMKEYVREYYREEGVVGYA